MGILGNLLGSLASGVMGAVVEAPGKLLNGEIDRFTNRSLTGKEKQQNAFNANEAEKNRMFQQQMASTQYQRAVSDMENAGVNPALAMSNGGNAAPSGSAASGSSSMLNGELPDFSSLVQLAMMPVEKRRVNSEIAINEAQKDNIEQDTATKKSAESLNLAQAAKHNYDVEFNKKVEEYRIAAIENSNNLTKEQIENVKAAREKLKEEVAYIKKQAATEDERRLLVQAETWLTRAKANEINQLLELKKGLLAAQTEQAKQAAALAFIQSVAETDLVQYGYYREKAFKEGYETDKAMREAIAAA